MRGPLAAAQARPWRPAGAPCRTQTGLAMEDMATRLRVYLSAEPRARVIEGHEVVLTLGGEHSGFAVTCENGKVVAHFWAPGHSLVRRVTALRATKHGLQLQTLRFGQRDATPLWIGAGGTRGETGGWGEYRASALAAIEREWAGWRPIPPAGVNPRGREKRSIEFFLFKRHHQLAAAVAVPPGGSQVVADSALAALALWTEQSLTNLGSGGVARWMIVLPARHASTTLGRLPWLRMADRIAAYELDDAAGHLTPLSPLGDGNWHSVVRRAPPFGARLPPAAAELWPLVRQLCPDAVAARTAAGVAFRLHGLTFTRQSRGAEAAVAPFTFGLGAAGEMPGWAGDLAWRPLTPDSMEQFRALLRRLNQERRATADAAGFLWQCQPESWMEAQIHRDLTGVDAALDPRFIYSQVPALRKGQREVMDLLAVEKDGRLRVLELKASENAQFPFQALDYWRAVRRHQERGDFSRLGYFPGLALRPDPPRLTLVAPALRWHPRTEALLSWLRPEIHVDRVGLDEKWRERLRVVERYGPLKR